MSAAQPLLSATLIVRNEERVLGACLASLDQIVDETIVVDTGSTDRSSELAACNGAKVFQFPWNDDFSAARNFAIEQASCPWLLYIDADERLRHGDRGRLQTALSTPGAIAATVRFYPRSGYTAYRECRLYRRDPRLRFEGVVHESMLPSIRRLIAAEGGKHIVDCGLTIDHVGYDGPQTHKAERYLRLLARATESDPERIYLWWHLGTIYRDLGRIEEAQACWRRGLALAHARGQREDDDCICHIELIKLELVSGGDAAELIAKGRRLRPDNHLLEWFEAKSLMRRGRFGDASAIFAGLSRIDPETLVAETAYDKRLFGVGAAELAGECAFRAGDYPEAAHWYGVAEAASGGALEYRCKRQLAELRSPPLRWLAELSGRANSKSQNRSADEEGRQ